jgi:predicted peptidase
MTRACRRLPCVALITLVAALIGPARANGAPVETGFINATVRLGENSLNYVVYVPRDYAPERAWPVVLFLHGAGERGDNGLAQTQTGVGPAIRLHPERFPCLVVMPQCPANKGWGPRLGNVAEATPEVADLALAALDATIQKYHGDPDRIYLTGLSLGGFGTWAIGARHPAKFAALMPICGGGRPADMAPLLKDLPIWVFHGDADPAVPVQRSRDMVEALKSAGNTKVKYTEYPGVGHNSWDRAYGDAEAIAWLLSQKREK